MKNFIEDLKWRGMIQDIMPGTEELLNKEQCTAYVGIDPTADSLHIGHLVSVMMLKHFQDAGHRPVSLIGGATGMIGDPSMKSQERNLLDEATLRHNQECIKAQLSKFIDFESKAPNAAILVNNYDWMKDYKFLDFSRDIGKLITVNYMMAKDSVKKRLSGEGREGMSFTEFTYQLLQGYDFLYLYQHYGCSIRRKLGGEAYGLTWPLMTKSDGGKFGKTEKGNIWLSPEYTTPYAFYQFWLNVSDEDAARYIKIFTTLSREEIEAAVAEHAKAPHLRELQKLLAREITVMVHGQDEYSKAMDASQILFGKSTSETLRSLDERTFLSVFDGVPQYSLSKDALPQNVIDLLAVTTDVFPSKGECRKMIQGGGLSLNKDRCDSADRTVSAEDLIDGKYILAQKGKKNYYILKFE